MDEKKIISRYKVWAKVYDKLLDNIFKFNRLNVIKKLNIKNKEKILEIGVGTGLNLKYYPSNCFVYGIDISKDMLDKAKKRTNKNVRLFLMNAEDLKFKDSFFDKVLATYVVRVSPNPNIMLKEIERVTKKNSVIILVDIFKPSFSSILDPLTNLIGWGKCYNLNELLMNNKLKLIKKENNTYTLVNKK